MDQVQCPACQALQPCQDLNAFEKLGVNKTFNIDHDQLEQKYFEKQRLVHPDRFATHSKQEKIYSAQHSAALNEAFATLKDPIRRTQLLLKLAGYQKLNIEHQSLQDPEVLLEVIELREQLVDAETMTQLQKLKDSLSVSIRQCEEALSVAFNDNDLDTAAQQLNRLTYFIKISHEAKHRRIF